MFEYVYKGISQQLRKIETKFKKRLSAESRGVLWDPTVVLIRQLGTEGVKFWHLRQIWSNTRAFRIIDNIYGSPFEIW